MNCINPHFVIKKSCALYINDNLTMGYRSTYDKLYQTTRADIEVFSSQSLVCVTDSVT